MEDEIALKSYQCVQRLVTLGDKTQYVFIPQNNISLAWVESRHVEEILRVKGGCCGAKKPIYTKASETDIRRWKYGGR